MKLSLLLLSFVITLTGCTSVNDYIKTRKSQYLNSQDSGPLKMPKGLNVHQTRYIIPAARTAKPNELPNLYPPTD
jgi:uncharacterized lipoprotein